MYTVEGVGNSTIGYHPIQKALARFNGTQCGFCSSGMVMNMYALYEKGSLTMEEVENAFGGNICRCTGYRPILAAFKTFCKDVDASVLGEYPDIEDLDRCTKRHGRCREICRRESVRFEQQGKSKWIKLFTLDSLLQILYNSINSVYLLVAGNTSKGSNDTVSNADSKCKQYFIGVYGGVKDVQVYIDITEVAELVNYRLEGDVLVLGANMTLTKAINLFEQLSKTNPKFAFLKQVADHIDLIANVPVRNVSRASI